MKCKHCFFELIKGYKKCSYCGNILSFKSVFSKSEETKELLNNYDEEIEKLKNEIKLMEKERKELREQLEHYKQVSAKYVKYSIEYVDTIDGLQFEEYTKELLEKLNYENVVLTPASNDYGVDVIAEKDGIKYGIQCKNYKDLVGNKSIQEVFSGKEYYRCQIGAVLTNSYFTTNAIAQAKSTGILLWDRNKLIEMINKAKNGS